MMGAAAAAFCCSRLAKNNNNNITSCIKLTAHSTNKVRNLLR